MVLSAVFAGVSAITGNYGGKRGQCKGGGAGCAQHHFLRASTQKVVLGVHNSGAEEGRVV